MKRGILLTSTDNYSSYPIKVIILSTPEEAILKLNELESVLESALDSTECSDWYVYPTLIDVDVPDAEVQEITE